MTYTVPSTYNFEGVHHPRPRFKSKEQEVLIYMATEISDIGCCSRDVFREKLNASIRAFPGNANKEDKTINNWRTEISSLFGFYMPTDDNGEHTCPGNRAVELARDQDLVRAFRLFLFFFQYPGGHMKPREVADLINAGVKFKPAHYFLRLLQHAVAVGSDNKGITSAEATYCVYNDLRVIRDGRSCSETWETIERNRREGDGYPATGGDPVRNAQDILDYLVTANLLKKTGPYYRLNSLENETISQFLSKDVFFDGYDFLYGRRVVNALDASKLERMWYLHVNQELPSDFLTTDPVALLSTDSEMYRELSISLKEILDRLHGSETIVPTTKQIGDAGEAIVYGHECEKLRRGEREDLIVRVNIIPTSLAAGYDVKSYTVEEEPLHIEVKTTVSPSELSFSKCSLTRNEWKVAETYGDSYWIYRLMLSKERIKLLAIQNPVGKYQTGNIFMTPQGGVDLSFRPERVGTYVDVLVWERH